MVGTSVFDQRFRFHAMRLLTDSVDIAIIRDGAPGRAAEALRALAVRCPGVLSETVQDSAKHTATAGVHFYRVNRDSPCSRDLARA